MQVGKRRDRRADRQCVSSATIQHCHCHHCYFYYQWGLPWIPVTAAVAISQNYSTGAWAINQQYISTIPPLLNQSYQYYQSRLPLLPTSPAITTNNYWQYYQPVLTLLPISTVIIITTAITTRTAIIIPLFLLSNTGVIATRTHTWAHTHTVTMATQFRKSQKGTQTRVLLVGLT